MRRVRPERLLRIGELAGQAGVSTRTVDHYTSLGLLTPAGRSTGNFRLYHPGDTDRIGLIRTLETHGLRLDEIAHALHADTTTQPGCSHHGDQDCPADPRTLPAHLDRLDTQAHAMRALTTTTHPPARGLLATAAARAAGLLADAAALATHHNPASPTRPRPAGPA